MRSRNLAALVLIVAAGCGTDNDPKPPDTAGNDALDTSGETDGASGTTDASGTDDAPVNDAEADVDAPAPHTREWDDLGWPIPYPAANALPREDPRYEGQAKFLWETWGTEVLGEWPPASFLVALQTDEPEVFGDQFRRFGFIPDPNRDLPLGLVRSRENPELVHETCATCHVAELPDGRVWFGAPASALDLAGFRKAVHQRWVAAGNPPFMDEVSLERADAYGPGRTAADTTLFETPVPADFPVYYNLRARTALNHLGTGRNVRTEAYFSLFAFGAGNPNDDEAVVPFPSEDQTRAFLDYLGTIDAPTGPAVDEALRARGEAVFVEARCNTCHHPDNPAADVVTPLDRSDNGRDRIPGDDPEWPKGSIRTSPAHFGLIDAGGGGGDQGRNDLIRFIVRRQLSVRQSDGYRISFLGGLWSSAPYLHNGSVPTLEDLLKPANERPRTFENRGFVVDTTLPWNSNQGHEFGVDLPEEDKRALVEWLRSL